MSEYSNKLYQIIIHQVAMIIHQSIQENERLEKVETTKIYRKKMLTLSLDIIIRTYKQ